LNHAFFPANECTARLKSTEKGKNFKDFVEKKEPVLLCFPTKERRWSLDLSRNRLHWMKAIPNMKEKPFIMIRGRGRGAVYCAHTLAFRGYMKEVEI